LKNKTIKESVENQFFTAQYSVNRHFRDWNLDEVADIYNELRILARDSNEDINPQLKKVSQTSHIY
jgi:hypothetical protein